MKNRTTNLEDKEALFMNPNGFLFTDPNPKDTPKPDGGEANGNEGDDEDEKPGENIFK